MSGPKDEPIGSFTTNPVEIDAIIRNDYDPIYHGNIEDLEEHASSFIKKFLPFLFQDAEFQVDPIEGPLLMELCTHGPFSSGGMDGWAPQDWSILPLQAFVWLAYLLNTIESGASWPRGRCMVNPVFFARILTTPHSNPLTSGFYFYFPSYIGGGHRIDCSHFSLGLLNGFWMRCMRVFQVGAPRMLGGFPLFYLKTPTWPVFLSLGVRLTFLNASIKFHEFFSNMFSF